MRITFIYLIICCCITLSVSAQNNNIETTIRDDFFSYPSKILSLDNNEKLIINSQYVIVEGPYPWNTFGRYIPQLDKLDASGNLLWSQTYPQSLDFDPILNPVIASDNSIYVLFSAIDCDVSLFYIIMKLDSDGNLLWEHQFSDFQRYSDMEANTNGGFWATLSDELIEYDGNHNVIQTISLPYDASNFDYDTSSGDFVVYSSAADTLMYRISGGDTYEIYLPQYLKVHFWGDYILAYSFNKIERYDKQLNLINSVELFDVYPEFDFDEDYIYLGNYAYNQPNKLLKLNGNLEIIDSTIWDLGNIMDIYIEDNDLYLLGMEYDHTYVKTLNNDLTYEHINADIGLTNILVATADSTCSNFQYCGDCNYDVTGIKAVVENFGTETINYFELNISYHECWGFCYHDYYNMVSYEDMYIPPGGVDTVDFPDLNLEDRPVDSRLCLYTTRPNKLIDKNHDNDEICRSFFENDITSVEPTEPQLQFSISPNPATNIIILQNTQINWQKADVKIINIEGKQINVSSAPQIDISTLPTGVYVVQCEYEGTTGSKRFVKYK